MCRLVDALNLGIETYGKSEETGECADEHLEDVRGEFA